MEASEAKRLPAQAEHVRVPSGKIASATKTALFETAPSLRIFTKIASMNITL